MARAVRGASRMVRNPAAFASYDQRPMPALQAPVLDVRLLGPLAGLGGFHSCAAPGANCALGSAAGPSGVREELPQRLSELVVVRGAEVDLVFGAVQVDADGAGRLAALEVVRQAGSESLGQPRNES
jgi:hypothetical protein